MARRGIILIERLMIKQKPPLIPPSSYMIHFVDRNRIRGATFTVPSPFRRSMIFFLPLLLVLYSCGFTPSSALKKRVEEYYTAWKFKDYSSMYYFLNDWARKEFSEDTFVKFLSEVDSGKEIYKPGDLEADYLRQLKPGGIDAFIIEEVLIQGDHAKIRLFLKTSKDLVGETLVDPNLWVREEGEWRVELTDQSPLYRNIQKWSGRYKKVETGSERGGQKGQLDQVKAVRETFKEIEGKIERYCEETGSYPQSLSLLPGGALYLDPFSSSGEFRYATDQQTFWIIASNGPDLRVDIEPQKFNGFLNSYPPPTLVYEPSTGQGDLYNFGPK